MTVGELIGELNHCPLDDEVVISVVPEGMIIGINKVGERIQDKFLMVESEEHWHDKSFG